MSSTDVRECLLLVMLAQVLEISRWNLLTFSAGAASVCEATLTIVRRVMKTFLDSKTTEGNATCTAVCAKLRSLHDTRPSQTKTLKMCLKNRDATVCSGRNSINQLVLKMFTV